MAKNSVIFKKFCVAVFRSHRARTLAQKLMSEQKMEKLEAAIIIQTYYRMWHCKSIYQQLLKFKSQKELQMIYFAQQVNRIYFAQHVIKIYFAQQVK